MIEHSLDLVTLEESGPYVPLLEHRDMRHVRELAVLPRQAEDALQGRQLAVDLAVREPPLFGIVSISIACDHHVSLSCQDESVDIRRRDRRRLPDGRSS